jgi:hypothetical protein
VCLEVDDWRLGFVRGLGVCGRNEGRSPILVPE